MNDCVPLRLLESMRLIGNGTLASLRKDCLCSGSLKGPWKYGSENDKPVACLFIGLTDSTLDAAIFTSQKNIL
jgi:hypothetical protein